MKNMKKFMAVMAVASLVATSGMTAFAYEYNGPQGDVTLPDTTPEEGETEFDYDSLTEEERFALEANANGHTTFAVVEAKENNDLSNVSFTVPLYVTMAVVDGSDQVQTPTNYEIRNTSQASEDANGNKEAYDISVIGMNFEKLEGSSYNTVEGIVNESDMELDDTLDNSGHDKKDMELSIGGYVMPALSVATAVDVILSAKNGTSFYADGAFTKIAPNGVLNLPLAAKLGAEADVDDNTPAVAQFKVKYTVGAVVTTGTGDDMTDMILAVYAGDDSVAAGLGKFDVETGLFPYQETSAE